MKLEIINEAEIINKRNKFGISIRYLFDRFSNRERVKDFDEELKGLRERIDETLSLKFVVVRREETIVAKIFHSDHRHSEELEPDKIDNFLGAGSYSLKEIEWGSFSFKDDLKRNDRPENTEEGQKILDGIRGAIQEWIGMLIHSNLRRPPTRSASEL